MQQINTASIDSEFKHTMLKSAHKPYNEKSPISE